jgi:hypothetical protein
MSNGSPGGYLGAMIPGARPGLKPSGVNVATTSGQVYSRLAGTVSVSRPCASKRAWPAYP